MKKLLVCLFVISVSAKAETCYLPQIIGEAALMASAALVPPAMNAMTAVISDSARDFLQNKMTSSEQKDKAQTELKTSTGMYSTAAVAAMILGTMMLANIHTPETLNSKPVQIVTISAMLLGLVTSAVRMGLNGNVYHEISQVISVSQLDTMLRFSIATLATTVVADAIFAYKLFKSLPSLVTAADA